MLQGITLCNNGFLMISSIYLPLISLFHNWLSKYFVMEAILSILASYMNNGDCKKFSCDLVTSINDTNVAKMLTQSLIEILTSLACVTSQFLHDLTSTERAKISTHFDSVQQR